MKIDRGLIQQADTMEYNLPAIVEMIANTVLLVSIQCVGVLVPLPKQH